MKFLSSKFLGSLLLFLLPLLSLGWKIKVGYSDTHATTGNFYTIRCNVIDIEEPPETIDISFHKDGSSKSISKTKTPKKIKNAEEYYSVLILPNVKREDSGYYECVVNIDGEEQTSEKIELNIVDAPQFIDPKPLQTPEEGSNANISCLVKNHDDYDIYWTFNGTIIQEGTPRNYDFLEGSQILVIPKFDSSVDNGLYECVAAYHNTIEKMSIEVIGYARPTMTVFEPFNITETSEGSNFAVQCQAVGKPKPTYEWRVTKNGIESKVENTDKFKVDGGLLTVDAIDIDDSGKYTCIATNAMGSVNDSVEVKVVRKATIKTLPDILALKDDNVTMECHYESEGAAVARWFYEESLANESEEDDSEEDSSSELNFTEIEENESYNITTGENYIKLTITNITMANVGKYRCSVENVAGISVKDIDVNIKFAPIPKPIENTEIKVFMNEVIKMSCSFDGMPKPEIEWYFNGNIVYPDGVKVIKNDLGLTSNLIIDGTQSKEVHFGTYKCLASNSLKKSVPSEEINVYLLEAPEALFISCSDDLSATKATCNIDPGAYPGRRPDTLSIYYYEEGKYEDLDDFDWRRNAIRLNMNFSETIIISDLKPNTSYQGRVEGTNLAGISPLGPIFLFQTEPPSPPEAVEEMEVNCHYHCDFIWKDAELNGGYGLKYRLTFNATRNLKTDNNNPEDLHYITVETSDNKLTFDQLRPEIEYTISIITITEQGTSEPYFKVIETPESLQTSPPTRWPLGSLTKFLAVAGLSMVVIITTIDLVFYVTYHCGIIVFILTHCCGKKMSKPLPQADDLENVGPERNKLLSENQPTNV
uniref:Fasciclin-2-like n=1 Tax=Parastrongyloides trichosuri TaxID=131310 RepID=A0A0N4Z7Z3_PARTI